MNKSEEFIEGRIRWRGEQYKIPYPNTNYWECVSGEYKASLNLNVGKPVVVSISDSANFGVLCTQGFIIKNKGVLTSIPYEDIESIHYPPLPKSSGKSEANTFELHMRNKQTQSVRVESGEAYFAVSSILSMLVKLS